MIQIITNRQGYFREWKTVEISSFGSPKAFDTFEINIIDLNDDSIWQNNGDACNQVEIKKDFVSISGIFEASISAKCVIVFPQNRTYKYDYGYIGDGRSKGYRKRCLIKDILEETRTRILEPLLPLKKYPYGLRYENNVTEVNGLEYSSSFYFCCEEKAVTRAKYSKKVTTYQAGERLYLCSLDIFENLEALQNYLLSVGMVQRERSKYPEWLSSFEMFNDAEMLRGIDTCNLIIREAEKKKEDHLEQLYENLKYKSILYTNGSELVCDVFRILEQILSYDLATFIDKKKEDFRVELEDITFVGEIKGVTSNVKSENISQVDVHYQGYMDEQQEKGANKPAKPILIMNPFRTKPLEQREPVHKNQIRLAKRNNCLIIETITLLRVFEKFKNGELDTEKIIDVFTNTSGLLLMSDFE